MDPTPQMYFILRSNCGTSTVGSLHCSSEPIKKGSQGVTIRTEDLDRNFFQDILYEELLHLPGERTYQFLLPVEAQARWRLLNQPDFPKLIFLQVGQPVYFNGEPALIRGIGPTKLAVRGWFFLLELSQKIGSSVTTSIANLSIHPPLSDGVYEMIRQYEAQCNTVENRNYANSYYSHHQNAARLSGSRALATPYPNQSGLIQTNSFKTHSLGRSKESSRIPGQYVDSSSRHIQDNKLLSKSEIDGQISSYINGSGSLDRRSNEPGPFPVEVPYQIYSRDPPPFPMPDMMRDNLTYSTVIKEDNQKRTTRFVPNYLTADTEISFSTALNIRDEEENISPTMRDYQTVRSRQSTSPGSSVSNNNLECGSTTCSPISAKASTEKAVRQQNEHDSATLESIKALNCELDTISPKSKYRSWEVGSLVEVHVQAKPLYGVIKWIGRIPPSNWDYIGIELEERLEGAGNGFVNGKQVFDSPDHHGIFVTLTKVLKDKRFINPEEECNEESLHMNIYENCDRKVGDISSSNGDFGFTECPSVPGRIPPINIRDFESLIGRNKGIQGFHNSCYLDSTIFAMFSFTSVFDFLLYRPPNAKDIKEYSELQKVLREDIVNPLRKNFFVRADKVMKLRKFLGCLSDIEGLTSEEKDPEELLNSLLCQTLKANPFLHLSSGQTSHYYQLFVERDEFRKTSPTVQELFEQSFFTSDVKLKSVPSVLILQMPRFGKQFKVYDRIRPTQTLDITDIIEGAPRQCIICGNLASLECHSCFGVHGHGLDSTAFCRICSDRTHSHKNRQHHSVRNLVLPQGFIHNRNCTSRLYMKLFAVLCIETSHYVTFSKCSDGPKAPWCLFDSMADRKGEANGYNIPEVSRAYDLEDYFSQPENSEEPKHLTPHVKRLLGDGYMYFYQSQEVMMYQ